MHLVEVVNYEVVPTQECFMCRPLRQLYNTDRSKNKEKFMQQLSVVYFMADPRSSYNYITDDNDRLELIKEQEGLDKNYKIDDKVAEAIEWYKKHTITTSTLMLESTRMAADKVREFLKNIDLTQLDDKGKPRYTINTVTAALKQIPQIAKDLREAEKALSQEIEEVGRARGGNERKKAFEDGV